MSSKCVLFVATDLESAVIKWLCEWWHLLFRLDIQSIPWPWSHGMSLSYLTRDAQSFWLMHRNFTLESPPNLRWLLEWIVGGSLPCCESSSLLCFLNIVYMQVYFFLIISLLGKRLGLHDCHIIIAPQSGSANDCRHIKMDNQCVEKKKLNIARSWKENQKAQWAIISSP